jgi:hypothetical protein
VHFKKLPIALKQSYILQKGQGLGKNSEGFAEPIKVDIKLNRKGLVSQNENKTNYESPIVQSCGKKIDLKFFFLKIKLN